MLFNCFLYNQSGYLFRVEMRYLCSTVTFNASQYIKHSDMITNISLSVRAIGILLGYHAVFIARNIASINVCQCRRSHITFIHTKWSCLINHDYLSCCYKKCSSFEPEILQKNIQKTINIQAWLLYVHVLYLQRFFQPFTIIHLSL